MKLTYFGTAAAEGFPAVFCHCRYCQEARRLGGKNIRTRSQAMINDDLLIDLPADTYSHFLSNGVEGDRIKYLFVTHAHSDHLYPKELTMRSGVYAHDMQVPILKVFCGQKAYDALQELGEENGTFEPVLVTPFLPVTAGKYTVTPLPARHYIGTGAVFYLIEDGERALLYAHDTGYFYDEVFAFLQEKKVTLDLVSLDCTCVDIPLGDDATHMGIPNNERVIERLRSFGAVNDSTKIVINHFSHNGNPIHTVLEERVKPLGYLVSYDGMQITV